MSDLKKFGGRSRRRWANSRRRRILDADADDGIATPPQSENLVVLLDAANYAGSGDTWYDTSGSGNDGVFFDGADDAEAAFVDAGDSSYFDLDVLPSSGGKRWAMASDASLNMNGSDDWAVSVLINPSALDTSRYLFVNNNRFNVLWGWNGGGRMQMFLNNVRYTDAAVGLDVQVAGIGEWFLFTLRRSGTEIQYNCNGTWGSVSASSAPTITSSGSYFNLGSWGAASSAYNGKIAGAWLWKGGPLTDDDVATHVANIGARYTLSENFG